MLSALTACQPAITDLRPAPEAEEKPVPVPPAESLLLGEWMVTSVNGEPATGTFELHRNAAEFNFCNRTAALPMVSGDGTQHGDVRVDGNRILITAGVLQTERGCSLPDGSPAPAQRWDEVALLLLRGTIIAQPLPSGGYRLSNGEAAIEIGRR